MSATLGLSESEWHAIRAKHVGGSEIAALFGVEQPYQLSHFALWQVKAGKIFAPEVSGKRILWGNRLETVIAECAADQEEWTISKGRYHTDERTEGLGASIDFEIAAPGPRDGDVAGPGVLEVKNVDWMVHRSKWTGGEPPLHILLQLQHQLAATGYQWGAVAALVGGNELVVYRYTARPRLIADIRRKVAAFWQSIKDGKEPDLDGTQSTAEALRALYPELVDEAVDLSEDNEFPTLVARLVETSQRRREIAEEEQELKNRIAAKLGDCRRGWAGPYSASMSVTAAKPDRVAQPGEIIKGRAETRRLIVKVKDETE